MWKRGFVGRSPRVGHRRTLHCGVHADESAQDHGEGQYHRYRLQPQHALYVLQTPDTVSRRRNPVQSTVNRDTLHPPFDDWLTGIFAEAPRDSDWYHRDYGRGWSEDRNPDRAVECLTRLFHQPLVLNDRFNPAQIHRGLEFLAFSGNSGYLAALTGEEVPWPQRAECMAAIPNLFRDVLVPFLRP
jgi:hypothetical protein